MIKKENIRGAFIGFGNIAYKGHLPAFKELDIEIVAAVDVCKKRRRIAEESGIKSYKKLDELIGLDLDFIDICTPPSYRYEAIKFAVEHNMDVICEKPISIPGELSRIKDLVLKSNIFFFPVHNWKHAPHYKKVKEIVKKNGGVQRLNMNTLRTHFSTGNPDWDPDWRVKKKISGGGIIMDHGYHNIYLAMHLFGSEFTGVSLDDVEYFKLNPGIEKRATFSLKFPDDRCAEITLDWGASKREIKNTIYECNSSLVLEDQKIVNSEHTYEFEESLSGDSVHGTWFKNVFMDFISLRNSKEKSHFLEAIRVLTGIEDLYKQSRKEKVL